MKEPLVYIIILNWNGYLNTFECIKSLNKISYRNYKILIVDNASTDNSVKLIKKTYRSIELIVNKENLGFSGGVNVGIVHALNNNAEYVLLLNNDTYVEKKFLNKLVKKAEDNKDVGIVTPKIYYANKPKVIWSTGAFKREKRIFRFLDISNGQLDKGQFDNKKNIDCVWGCCILIKKETLEKVGYFDDSFFLYLEDVDYCIRITKKKYKILLSADSIIWHKVSGSSGGEGSLRQHYYNTRNYFILARKNLNYIDRTIFFYYYFVDKFVEIYKLLKNKKFNYVRISIVAIIHGITGVTGKYNI